MYIHIAHHFLKKIHTSFQNQFLSSSISCFIIFTLSVETVNINQITTIIHQKIILYVYSYINISKIGITRKNVKLIKAIKETISHLVSSIQNLSSSFSKLSVSLFVCFSEVFFVISFSFLFSFSSLF
jgi:predicted PurR-regulated permease PerM